MKLMYLRRIESAVKSITSCTAPRIQVGDVVVTGNHLCSPYVSHHTVEYDASENIGRAIYASSYRHAIMIGVDNPGDVVPPYPINGMVSEWVGGLAPVSLIAPIIELSQRLGLDPVEREGLVNVWVLSQVLAGWHYMQPVAYLAHGDNTPIEIVGVQEHRQGKLLVGWKNSTNLFRFPSWLAIGKRRFFGHVLLEPEQEDVSCTDDNAVYPVAVMYNGAPHCAMRLSGNHNIVSARHGVMKIIGDDEWLAIHTFVGE